jgi:hypothetical protein
LRTKSIIGLASTGALACVGILGLTTSAAFGAKAVKVPIANVPIIVPSPDGSPLPSSGQGVQIAPDCLNLPEFGFLFTDVIGLQFDAGHAHIYRVDSQGNPGGANVEGNATLVDVTTGYQTQWSGMTHYWFGQNTNPNFSLTGNMQQYFGETVSFSGSASDGSTISITANPGGVTSASGHSSGWGHLKVTCTPPTV